MKVYGWSAPKLADAYTFAELNTLRESIEREPTNRTAPGNLYLFKPAARRKLDAIAWAVTHKLREARNNS